MAEPHAFVPFVNSFAVRAQIERIKIVGEYQAVARGLGRGTLCECMSRDKSTENREYRDSNHPAFAQYGDSERYKYH